MSGLTIKDWAEGARVRTLPAALAPVILGSYCALALGAFQILHATLALLVALFLQVGVNFSNDYSDGVRGTDQMRVGPKRLTASGTLTPGRVLVLALASYALAGVFGLVLLALSQAWFLLPLGIGAVVAGWFYTGGKRPYGYLGLGEIFVLVFFGFFATVGTVYVQAKVAPWWVWTSATGIGLLSCALLMVNNIRDIPTDRMVGKFTLAARLGDRWARVVYAGELVVALVLGAVSVGCSVALLFLVVLVILAAKLSVFVLRGASGTALLPVLRDTGIFTLAWAFIVGGGLIY